MILCTVCVCGAVRYTAKSKSGSNIRLQSIPVVAYCVCVCMSVCIIALSCVVHCSRTLGQHYRPYYLYAHAHAYALAESPSLALNLSTLARRFFRNFAKYHIEPRAASRPVSL